MVVGSVAVAALVTWLLATHATGAIDRVHRRGDRERLVRRGRAGLTSSALSILTFEVLFHRSPPENFMAWAVRTMMFVAVSMMVSYFEAKLRNALELLETANRELRDTLDHVRKLESLLPICAGCKRIRKHTGDWVIFERYLHDTAGTNFTHGLCPVCYRKYSGEETKTAS